MRSSPLRYVLNIVIMLSLGVWIGSLVFFGAGVAGVVFSPGLLPDRTTAGAVNSAILARLGTIEMVVGVLLLAGTLYMAVRGRTVLNWLVLLLSVAMLAVAAYYTNVLFPEMNELRVAIGNFDRIVGEKAPLKAAFDNGHQLYSMLVKGVLAAGVLALVLHTIALVRSASVPVLATGKSPEAGEGDRQESPIPAALSPRPATAAEPVEQHAREASQRSPVSEEKV